MMWATYTMQELINEISMGPFGSDIKKSVYTNSGVPVLNGSNLQGFTLKENSFGYVSEEKADSLKKCNAHRGDIIVTHRGTLGQIVYIPNNSLFERYVISQSQFRFNLKPELARAEFIVYYFHTREGQHKILSNASQVGVPALARATTTFRQLEVKVPPLPVQDKIIGILSALDSKIENNNKINANLEAQAQALFKSWFVDFTPFKDQPFVDSELGPIPQGWKVVSLDDMTSKVGTGLNPRKNFTLGQGSNYYVTIKNMYNNRVYLDSRCDKITDEAIQKIQKRSKLQVGDLLFSGIGTIGRVALINKSPYNWNTSESVFNLHPSEEISSEFLYLLLLSNFFQNYVKINTLGGVQQGIRMASLKSFRMALPDRNVLIAFDRIIQPIVADIKRNDDENDSLAALRDTLLPKLMSGEIKL